MMSDTISIITDATEASDLTSVSMTTTLADNVFQDGLAQLDANIARLQQSLMRSSQNISRVSND